jgi:F-type H+-transporting ATPase subunit delta
MKEQITARIYAKSFLELGKDNNINIAEELTKFNETINSSNDLENVLFLDVFSNDEKLDVFKAIAEKIKLAPIVISAINYLIQEKRIGLLPVIYKEIIVIDDHEKGFLRGVIEGSADSISDDYKNKLIAAIKKELGGKEPILEYKQSNKVTAGYKVTVEDLQVDASVDNQLKHFKDSVLGQ